MLNLSNMPARAEFRLRQTIGDLIVDSLSRFAAEFLVHSEDVAQFVRQPHPVGVPRNRWKLFGEDLPDFAVVGFHLASVNSRNAQSSSRNALRVEHPENVVVGNEQQIGGRAELIVGIGEHARVNVAVRADQAVCRRPVGIDAARSLSVSDRDRSNDLQAKRLSLSQLLLFELEVTCTRILTDAD